jgi:hypothetical protein
MCVCLRSPVSRVSSRALGKIQLGLVRATVHSTGVLSFLLCHHQLSSFGSMPVPAKKSSCELCDVSRPEKEAHGERMGSAWGAHQCACGSASVLVRVRQWSAESI